MACIPVGWVHGLIHGKRGNGSDTQKRTSVPRQSCTCLTRGGALRHPVSSTIRFASLYCGLPPLLPESTDCKGSQELFGFLRYHKADRRGQRHCPPQTHTRFTAMPTKSQLLTEIGPTTCPWSKANLPPHNRRTWKPATGKAECSRQHWNIRRG